MIGDQRTDLKDAEAVCLLQARQTGATLMEWAEASFDHKGRLPSLLSSTAGRTRREPLFRQAQPGSI